MRIQPSLRPARETRLSPLPRSPPPHSPIPITRPTMPPPPSSRTLHISGIPVSFPHTPYRAQSALMHAAITAIRHRHNALIESPTGTGKSLALLCSSLAFQAHAVSTQSVASPTPPPPVTLPVPVPMATSSPQNSEGERNEDEDDDDDDDDFAPPKKFRKVPWQMSRRGGASAGAPVELPANSYMLDLRVNPFVRERMLDSQPDVQGGLNGTQTQNVTQGGREKRPRVFYATRTHKQVAHVVAELRKTTYRPRMCVLASRREYCLWDEVRESGGRDELCKVMVKRGECEYYFKSEEVATAGGLRDDVWDIEEMIQVGRRVSGCSYFASHELYEDAELVLCPYSYLVDPIVRGARGINVTGDVVILDEAHNIEGYARDSVGFSAEVADMRRACDEVDTLLLTERIGANDLARAYRSLIGVLQSFMTLVDRVVAADTLRTFDRVENVVFEEDELVQTLKLAGVEEEQVARWRASYEYIVNYGDGNEAKRIKRMGEHNPSDGTGASKSEGKENDTANAIVCQTAKPEQTAQAVKSGGYGYGHVSGPNANGLHMEKSAADSKSRPGPRGRKGRNIRKQGRRRRVNDPSTVDRTPWVAKCITMTHGLLTTLEYLFRYPRDFTLVIERRTVDFVTAIKLNIVCLNAAVCFRDISSKARSVIVTSGTLTPLESFAGELGTAFEIIKTLPHIVDVKNQLYVGVVPEGPGRARFDATFHGASTFEFQDSLGQALLDYCRVIPQGVLVFFPSYRMMTQLYLRWQSSGMWDQLHRIKGTVMVEPMQRGDDFDKLVKQYEQGCESEQGAILFGVCRGKLSEGVDFRDATARAVVLVGIPFPHVGDMVMQRKRAYNDRMRQKDKQCKLQSGGEWYEMQAYRALNQALGRVVRHRFDYGAILLLDQRFRAPRVWAQLPGWTRKGIHMARGGHGGLLQGLERFFGTVQERVAETAAQARQQS